MENENQKKNNIFLFFIKMVIIFTIFDVLNSFIYPIISQSIYYGRFARELIPELACVFIALVVIILSKKTYIFTEKKETFFKSLKVGGFMLVYGIFLFIYSLTEIKYPIKLFDIISLVLLCISVGIFEEFINRGWIQNAFIEKFGHNRKQVILSITLSSLIFGGMHISNIWIGGQGVIETVSQIIQATGLGILLGSVYYRTKNIWACVFFHSFWDFAIFLREINTIKSCTEGAITNSYLISTLITSIILTSIYFLISLYILRKSKINNLAETYSEEEIKKSESQKGKFIYLIIILYFGMTFVPLKDNDICYSYEKKELSYNEIAYPKYSRYTIKEDAAYINLSKTDEDKLLIKSNDSELVLNIDNIKKFMVIKNNEVYEIVLLAYNSNHTDTIMYYSNYITSKNITNKEDYLNNISTSFKQIDSAPTIDKIGYITSLDNNIKYPIIDTTKSDRLVLTDEELFILSPKEINDENSLNTNEENNQDNTNSEQFIENNE